MYYFPAMFMFSFCVWECQVLNIVSFRIYLEKYPASIDKVFETNFRFNVNTAH